MPNSFHDMVTNYTEEHGTFDAQITDVSDGSAFHTDLTRGLFFDFTGVSHLSPEAQRGLSLLAWTLAYLKKLSDSSDVTHNDIANYTLGCISYVLNDAADSAELNADLAHIYQQASLINHRNQPPIYQEEDFRRILQATKDFVVKHENKIQHTEPDITLTQVAQNVSQEVISFLKDQQPKQEGNDAKEKRAALQTLTEYHADNNKLWLIVDTQHSAPCLAISQAYPASPISAKITNTNAFLLQSADYSKPRPLPLSQDKLAVRCQFEFSEEKQCFVEDKNSIRVSGAWAKEIEHPERLTAAMKKTYRQQLLPAYQRERSFEIQIVDKLPIQTQMRHKVIYLLRNPSHGYLRYTLLNKEGLQKFSRINQLQLGLSIPLNAAQQKTLLAHAAENQLIKEVTSKEERQAKIDELTNFYHEEKTKLWHHRHFSPQEETSYLSKFINIVNNVIGRVLNPALPYAYGEILSSLRYTLISNFNQNVLRNSTLSPGEKLAEIKSFQEENKEIFETQRKKVWLRPPGAKLYLNRKEKLILVSQLKEKLAQCTTPEEKIQLIQQFQADNKPIMGLHRLGFIGKTTGESYVDNLLKDAQNELAEKQAPKSRLKH